MSGNSCCGGDPQGEQCCCGPAANENIKYSHVSVTNRVVTEAGDVDVISAKWSLSDYVGMAKVRLGINRMNYAVAPGIYAVGTPGRQSPVLVSANYKLSFDVLRRELEGLNVWILVIDTKGINVWCAAGKGTFGTLEICKRIMLAQLEKIVSTGKIIVPQLGAPGVSCRMVREFSGFSVMYGPVRASDIKKYLAAGMKADTGMRRVLFGFVDRLTVSWREFFAALKPLVLVTLALAGVSVLTSGISGMAFLREELRALAILLWGAVIAGTVLNAVLLPFVPGRAFSLKGGILGFIVCVGVLFVSGRHLPAPVWFASALMASGISAFLALNFTGSSTYTSLSGVKKEIRYSIPVIIGMVSAGVILEIVHLLRRLL